jgi:nuclear receptor-binding protein
MNLSDVEMTKQAEEYTDEHQQRKSSVGDAVLAESFTRSGKPASTLKASEAPKREIEKFLEEVRNGAYPLTALRPTYRAPVVSRHSPETSDSPESFEEEVRRILSVECDLHRCPNNANCNGLSINLRMDDQMNRQITCDHHSETLPVNKLVEELIHFGLINGVCIFRLMFANNEANIFLLFLCLTG